MLMLVGDIGFILTALGFVTFAAVYSSIAPWWRTVTGRIMWGMAMSAAVIIALASYRLVFGPQAWLVWVRPFAYFSLAGVVWSAVIALVRVQMLRRRAIKANYKESRRSEDSVVSGG